MIDSFIPLELAVAPNPLGLTSNLKLTTIPIDAYTCFELWQPALDAVLMPEEAMLLSCDRSRLEEICAKLTHLLGATFTHSHRQPTHQSVERWQTVLNLIHQATDKVDAIAVSYLPQAIYPNLEDDEIATAWILRPISWNFSFLKLQPVQRGYKVEALPINLTISMGQLITKYIQTEKATVATITSN